MESSFKGYMWKLSKVSTVGQTKKTGWWDIFHSQNYLRMMRSIDGDVLYPKMHIRDQRDPVKRSSADIKMVPECRDGARWVYYGAEVVNYPDSYFLSPAPPRHPTPTVLPPR